MNYTSMIPTRPTAGTLTPQGWRADGIMNKTYRDLCGYPRRQAVKYNYAENCALLSQHFDGFSVQEIAEFHERTAWGVCIQIERLLGGKKLADRSKSCNG